MKTPLKTMLKVFLAAVAVAAVLALVCQAPLRWTAAKIHREMFPEQNPERPVYDDTAHAPVDLATFVKDARLAWPHANVAVVHGAALEVATGLLMHPDIEVGTMVNGTFVPWHLSPWKASAKIRDEVGGMAGFLSERSRYVFRRKTA